MVGACAGLHAVAAANNIAATDALAGLAKARFLAAYKVTMEEGEEPLKACVDYKGDPKFEFAEDLAQDEYGGATAPAVPRSHLPSESGAPVRTVSTKWTALHAACRAGSLDVVHTLLSSEGNANSRGNGVLTPVHEAARQGNAAVIGALLARGGNVHVKGHGDLTPLHIACRHGNAAAVATILDRGGDSRPTLLRLLGAKDAYGETPAMLCKRYKQRACAVELKGHAARMRCQSRQKRALAAKDAEKLVSGGIAAFEEAEILLGESLEGEATLGGNFATAAHPSLSLSPCLPFARSLTYCSLVVTCSGFRRIGRQPAGI